NQMPKGNVVEVLAVVLGNPGRIVIGAFARSAAVPVGSVPVLPIWYTVLMPFPPLPLVMYSVLWKIVIPRKFVSLPGLSVPNSKRPIIAMFGGTGGAWPATSSSEPVALIRSIPIGVVVSCFLD